MNIDSKLISLLPWVISDMDKAHVETIIKHGTKRTVLAGNTILHQGDIAEYIYYINKGTVKISSITHDGREKIYLFQSAGTFAGVVTLYHNYPSNAYDVAVEDCELYAIETSAFKSLLKNDPYLQEIIMETFAKIVRILIGELHSITFKTAEQKVCGLIYLIAARYGKATSQGIFIDMNMRHEDIASIYSLHRVTVTKIFQHLHDSNIIIKDKNTTITVVNMNELHNLAAFDIN